MSSARATAVVTIAVILSLLLGMAFFKVPRFKGISFETAIIEWYCRRESGVKEMSCLEIYLVGVSVCSYSGCYCS